MQALDLMGDAASLARGVLLLHELPDGGRHLDWLLERTRGASTLLSFRLDERIELMRATEFGAERIGEHRPHYLDFQGDLSPDSGGKPRGRVSRLLRVAVLDLVESDGELRLGVRAESGVERAWVGHRLTGLGDLEPAVARDLWKFRRADSLI